jgi:hypothetical protein
VCAYPFFRFFAPGPNLTATLVSSVSSLSRFRGTRADLRVAVDPEPEPDCVSVPSPTLRRLITPRESPASSATASVGGDLMGTSGEMAVECVGCSALRVFAGNVFGDWEDTSATVGGLSTTLNGNSELVEACEITSDPS